MTSTIFNYDMYNNMNKYLIFVIYGIMQTSAPKAKYEDKKTIFSLVCIISGIYICILVDNKMSKIIEYQDYCDRLRDWDIFCLMFDEDMIFI